jgi:hypothetical protein
VCHVNNVSNCLSGAVRCSTFGDFCRRKKSKQRPVLWKTSIVLLSCSDLGAHIDGFAAVVAHTLVLQEGPVTGKAADVIAAANTAAEVALRLVRPGKKVSLFSFRRLVFEFLFAF